MKAELKADWVEALRSRRYQQGRGCLRSPDDKYCCLGVLCDVIDNSKWEPDIEIECFGWGDNDIVKNISGFDQKQLEEIGLTFLHETKLINMNDVQKLTFDQIADYIEKEV